MTRFTVGEQVIVRYGRHQGQKATIIKSQPGDAYRVKVEDGTVLFFSSKGLGKGTSLNGRFVLQHSAIAPGATHVFALPGGAKHPSGVLRCPPDAP